jgi:phospholipase/lecithinase/hemolysin
LIKVEEQKQEFTSIAELRQIEALLLNLESRLNGFKQILPRLDRQRGLFNLGSAVLQTLFGTATSSDVMSLHTVINELQLNQKDIVHSMANQVTYIKKLDTICSTNVQAITNPSSIVKDVVVKSHDKFQEVTRDILWLNVTIYHQSEIYMTIRQLEFSLLQLT